VRNGGALGGGPYHFSPEAHVARPHPASARRAASSASRSPPPAPSAASRPTRPGRRTWPSNCTASPRRSRACAPGPPLAPASCSRRTAMICSSVNRLRFIRPSLRRDQPPKLDRSELARLSHPILGACPSRLHRT
jgi:hypothetical protein